MGVSLSGVLEEAPRPAPPIAVPKQAPPPLPSPGCSSGSDFGEGASDSGDRARSGSVNGSARTDARTAARLAELEESKAWAVQAEDYDEAKRLKQAIGRLRAAAEQLADLEDRHAPVLVGHSG